VYNPELEISASNADVDTRSVGIAQQIDWSGKRRARAAAADAETRAVEAERDSVRLRIALDFLRGAAALQVARDQVSLGAQRVEWLSKFSTLAQRRFRAGDIPVLERDFATLALQEARAAGRVDVRRSEGAPNADRGRGQRVGMARVADCAAGCR
jgi:cobalt-zinc-cadmium efflux system outer membrane protein